MTDFRIQPRGIGKMMYAEEHCRWRKDRRCTHPEVSRRSACPWSKRPDSLQDWYPCMFAEAEQ